MNDDPQERPECIGNKTDGKHCGVELSIIRSDGEPYWKCPECGWMLKEFFGESVGDHV